MLVGFWAPAQGSLVSGVTPVQDEALELQGVRCEGGAVPPGTFAATDATGGASKDTRLRVTLYQWVEGRPKLIGSATGLLRNEQSVYRGEAKAIQFCGVASRWGCRCYQ